jgi:hypothetical protein
MATIYDTFGQARGVLAAVRRLLKDVELRDNQTVILEPYKNGREKGFCLKAFRGNSYRKGVSYVSIAFAENRKSDDIVVYTDLMRDFDMQGNVPTEKAYEDRKYFGYQQYEKAAKHIVSIIKKYGAKPEAARKAA